MLLLLFMLLLLEEAAGLFDDALPSGEGLLVAVELLGRGVRGAADGRGAAFDEV